MPKFSTKAIIGRDDLYLDAVPLDVSTCPNVTTLCRKLTTSDPDVESTIEDRDNILKLLRDYYKHVKMKRDQNFPVPKGFWPLSTHQQLHFHEPSLPLDTDLLEICDYSTLSSPPSCNDSSGLIVPIIRCVDKPSTSLPHTITFSDDLICASVGFCHIDSIEKYLQALYQNIVKLDSITVDAVFDVGDTATLCKSPCNTSPVPRPPSFGDIIHMDIGFRPEVSIGNIRYGLLFMDHFSRMTYLYPFQNLTSGIQKQLEAFFAHIGFSPKRLISDFDPKLIGGKAREYLNTLKIHINAAPAYREDKNGLAERHWQTIIAMARNSLASVELPSKFCFFAVKCVAKVCNYFLLRLEDGTFSTPFELVHKCKPDLRVLFKPFSLAAVQH